MVLGSSVFGHGKGEDEPDLLGMFEVNPTMLHALPVHSRRCNLPENFPPGKEKKDLGSGASISGRSLVLAHITPTRNSDINRRSPETRTPDHPFLSGLENLDLLTCC
jgi:hypothetical protein